MNYINPFDWHAGFYIPPGVAKLDISPSAKLIYGVLARYAKKEGHAWPKQETIAKCLNISLRQTQRGIKTLQDCGLIYIEKPEGKERLKNQTSRYFFNNHPCLHSEIKTAPERGDIHDASRGDIHDASRGDIHDASLNTNTQKSLNTKDRKHFAKAKCNTPSGVCEGVGLKLRRGARKSDKIRSKAQTLDRKQKPEVKVSNKIQEYIDMWEAKGFMVSGRTTKTFASSVAILKKLVRGVFFNDKPDYKEFHDAKLNLEAWEMVLDRYEKMFSPLYQPRDKKWLRMSLSNFIWNTFSRNGASSLFTKLLSEEPLPITEMKYPTLTNQIIKQFGRKILKEDDYIPDDSELSKFIIAGNKCGDWFSDLKRKGKRIIPHVRVTEHKKAGWLINSVLKDTEDRYVAITPGWLASKQTINSRLPTYMRKQELLVSVSPLRRK